jgi:hypothetical protein
MPDMYHSLSHSRWHGKDYVVSGPKRRQEAFGRGARQPRPSALTSNRSMPPCVNRSTETTTDVSRAETFVRETDRFTERDTPECVPPTSSS